MAMMERAFSLFSPFYRPGDPPPSPGSPESSLTQEIAQLRAEVESLRRQLAEAKAKAKA
jgi:hypothetical protein